MTFWEKNWRKDGLQDRRGVLLKEFGFYNQHWCGCEYSWRDTLVRDLEKLDCGVLAPAVEPHHGARKH